MSRFDNLSENWSVRCVIAFIMRLAVRERKNIFLSTPTCLIPFRFFIYREWRVALRLLLI